MDYATYNNAQQIKQEKYDYAQNDRRKSSKKAVNHVVGGFPKLCEVGVHNKNSLQGATSAGLRMSRPANQKAYLLLPLGLAGICLCCLCSNCCICASPLSVALIVDGPDPVASGMLAVPSRVALLAFAAVSGASDPVPLIIEHRPSYCCWHCVFSAQSLWPGGGGPGELAGLSRRSVSRRDPSLNCSRA